MKQLLILFLLCIPPLLGFSQNKTKSTQPTIGKATSTVQAQKTEKTTLKYIPKELDVIYQNEELSDYLPDEDFVDDEETDEGTESESDILYASFDTSAIHYPKFDFSKKEDTTLLVLVSKKNIYIHPFKGRTTSYFGPRGRRHHYGIDISLNTGDPIVSAFSGIVRIAKMNKTYGNLVVIRHENGLETFYAHLSAIDVEPGQTVKAGDQLGLGGNTGRSRGSHLHFEVRYLGAAMDPGKLIDFNKYCLHSDTLLLTKEYFQHQSSSNKQLLASSSKKTKYYTVRKGDTLGAIARKNRTTVKKLCQLNKMKANKSIKPGKKLRVS